VSASLYTTQEEAAYGSRSNLETSREARPSHRAERSARHGLRLSEARKEPLTDARHVRDAAGRFDQVIDVSDADRTLAFANIQKAARYYGVNLSETDWHQLGVRPQQNLRAAAAKAAATRRARGRRATTETDSR
jgi:hypothetical protein